MQGRKGLLIMFHQFSSIFRILIFHDTHRQQEGRREGIMQGRKDCSSCFISFHPFSGFSFFMILIVIFTTLHDFRSIVQLFHHFSELFLRVNDFLLVFPDVSWFRMIYHPFS